jgi:hypothetical protein
MARNEIAKAHDQAILFNPSIMNKDNLTDCIRIFMNPNQISETSAKHPETRRMRLRIQERTTYTVQMEPVSITEKKTHTAGAAYG